MDNQEIIDVLDKTKEYIDRIDKENEILSFQVRYLINILIANNIIYQFEGEEGNYPEYWWNRVREVTEKNMEVEDE